MMHDGRRRVSNRRPGRIYWRGPLSVRLVITIVAVIVIAAAVGIAIG